MARLSARHLLAVAAARGNKTPMLSFRETRGSKLGNDDRRQQGFRGRRSLILAAGGWQRREAGTRATPSAGVFPYGRIRYG
jgi:hypothetical protein